MSLMLGIDLGGTAIKSALVDRSGKISDPRSTPTPQGDPQGLEAIKALTDLVKSYQQTASVAGVGLLVPGLVDPENGIAIYSGTLGWRDLAIADLLEAKVGTRVTLEHDVTGIAHAENRIGAAKDAKSAVVVAIGTALAASVILQGEVYHPHPAVGELGHTPTINQRPCVCGLKGCLEMTASGGALSRNYFAITQEHLGAMEIFDRARTGERVAAELVQEFVDVLSTSFVYISALLGPELIVIAGGVSKAGEDLIAKLNEALDQKLTIHRRPKLVLSQLPSGSGSIGAGLLAWERLI
ncbi:MAG: ROK family protein [Aquiluna sp.]|nr:ROK family protein [Aquiluna sp.]